MPGHNTVDVLNATLQQLNKDLLNTVESFTPTLTVLGKRERKYNGGTYIEKIICGESTGRVFGVYDPGMRFTFSSKQNLRRIRVASHRMVLTFCIPKGELAVNSGPAQIVSIKDAKVAPTLNQFRNELNSHFVMGTNSYGADGAGTPSDYYGLLSLNGDFASGLIEGTENGLFDAAAFTSQSDTVQGLAKSSTYRYANQYAACSSFAGDFISTYVGLQRECRKYSTAQGSPSGPKVMICDSGTYMNLQLFMFNRAVPATVVDAKKDDGVMTANSMRFFDAEWIDEPAIVLSSFATAALQKGCVYGIKPEHFDLQFATMPTVSPWVDDPTSDNLLAKAEIHGAMACVGPLADQFLMAGSAV